MSIVLQKQLDECNEANAALRTFIKDHVPATESDSMLYSELANTNSSDTDPDSMMYSKLPENALSLHLTESETSTGATVISDDRDFLVYLTYGNVMQNINTHKEQLERRHPELYIKISNCLNQKNCEHETLIRKYITEETAVLEVDQQDR